MKALIMAGGIGTRFWPLSRRNMPKQFLCITGDKSMLQMTVERVCRTIDINDVYIVTAQSQTELVHQHLPNLPVQNIIIEPFGMNTAPCIGLSLAYLKDKMEGNESLLVLPSDHVIKDTQGFLDSLKLAEKPAADGNLVTFGIVPDYPATGYGYIEAGGQIAEGVYRVAKFKEKPDFDTAKTFLQQGNYYWNSGMFFWKFNVIWQAFAEYLPQVMSILQEIIGMWQKDGEPADLKDVYAKMPKIPIDIGIMEKAEKRVVIPVNYGWSDVGSWKALAEISPADENGNFLPKRHFALDAKDNYVRSDKFVSLIGVENLCVIETDDALLITAKDRSEDVKKVVDALTATKQDDLL